MARGDPEQDHSEAHPQARQRVQAHPVPETCPGGETGGLPQTPGNREALQRAPCGPRHQALPEALPSLERIPHPLPDPSAEAGEAPLPDQAAQALCGSSAQAVRSGQEVPGRRACAHSQTVRCAHLQTGASRSAPQGSEGYQCV